MSTVEMKQGVRLATLLLAASGLLLPLVVPPPAWAGKPTEVGKADELFDQYGRVIRDAGGQRHSYGRDETEGLGSRIGGPGIGSPAAAPEPALKATIGVDLEWHRAIWGVGIGDTGLHAADLDGDGTLEMVVGAGPRDFFQNDYWYVLRAIASDFQQVWARHQYTSSITSLTVADLDGDGDAEVLVGVGGDVLIYDGLDPVLDRTIPTAATDVRGLTAADSDGDGQLELVFVDASNLYVYDLATGLLELTGAGLGGLDLAVGEITADAGAEIVIANGTAAGWVVSGATAAVLWQRTAGFGQDVALSDLDGDGLEEIAAGFRWNDVSVWNGDTQDLVYTIDVFNEFAALEFRDTDGDAVPELVWADAQWGDLHFHDAATGASLGTLDNPEHGVTGIEVADVDGDGDLEVVWGAGFTSTGPDFLFIYDLAVQFLQWQSKDFGGPFLGLDHGDYDADGLPELLYGSFESESGLGDGLFFMHRAFDDHALFFDSGEPMNGQSLAGLRRLRHAQLDGDAAEEILVALDRLFNGSIVVYDGATLFRQLEIPTESGLNVLGLETGDLDGDGAVEIVASTGREHTGATGVYVYVFDAAGALEWRSPSLGAASFVDYPFLRLADVDGDPAVEIVVGNDGGELYVFDGVSHAQELLTGDLNLSALATPDRDGDGKAEIVIGNTSGTIAVLDPATGGVTETIGSFGARIDGLAVADADVDGSADYVFAAADSVRLVSGATGATLWSSGDVGTAVGTDDSLLLADLDGDGRLEIFVNLGEVGVRIYQIHRGEPEVTITAPPAVSLFDEGETVDFAGTAFDLQDGDLSASLAWTSDLDGALGTGATLAVSTLTPGAHTVTAEVTDSSGLPGSDQVTVLINAVPTVTITAPTDGLAAVEQTPVTFTGSASDLEDGDLTAALSWSSSLDGAIGSGGSFTTSGLSVGTHLVTASASDSQGAQGADAITVVIRANTPPVVTIGAPADGSAFVEQRPVTFAGSASDLEDGDLTASLSWSSDLDGVIGSGGSFSTAGLSIGTHLVTASVADGHGAEGSDAITVMIHANTPPVVTITAPADGASFTVGDLVTLTGSASDLEDGDLSASLAWTSSRDGALGAGASLQIGSLSIGQHTITAATSDSHGAPGSDAVSVRIRPLPVTVTFFSTPIEDGWVLESDEDSGVGGSSASSVSGNQEATALRVGDDGKDRQYKTLLGFDTSPIPDAAEIQDVTLTLVRGDLVGDNPFDTHGDLLVDVQRGWFGPTWTILLGDFQAGATATASATLSRADADLAASVGSLDAAGRFAIYKEGRTQMRVYFALDDNDDRRNDYLGYYSGDTQDQSLVPRITVTYQE